MRAPPSSPALSTSPPSSAAASTLPGPASALACRGGLIDRYLPASIETPPAEPLSTREWIALVTSRLTASQALAIIEHQFGVLPLTPCFDCSHDAIAALASGKTLGALGLFTPNPECAWAAVPLTGEWIAGSLNVRGEVRLPYGAVDGAIVPVRITEADRRLVWLDLRSDGVDRRESRTSSRSTEGASSCWLRIDGASITSAAVSQPITRASRGELYRQLYAYAGIWALAAVLVARRIVLDLRRAARTTKCHGRPDALKDSQLVSIDLAEVEIETELVTAAVDQAISSAESAITPMLALSAARALGAAAETARRLSDQLGLPLDDWLADASAPALTMYLGGMPMLECELARALDIGRATAGDLR
jgi:alkylation response protein AidB-like acyl-CoA dehydrogenase